MEEHIELKTVIKEQVDLIVGAKHSGLRLDQFLGQSDCEHITHFSRSAFKGLIDQGNVFVNGKSAKASCRLKTDDKITVFVPPPEPLDLVPEKVNFDIVHEDSDIIVVSKPPNLVVHPAFGHQKGTLVHGLLYHCKDLGGINGTVRPGIVHRLDKNTSGLMVVAKNDHALGGIVEQFKAKSVEKIYLAIIHAVPTALSGTIQSNIGRHPINRKKMAVLTHGGRESLTHWRLVEELGKFSLVEMRLETGRTHQIRVHMTSIGLPIAGDAVYGKKRIEDTSLCIERQCLHASKLKFFHPRTNKRLEFYAPLWPDIENTLAVLRQQKEMRS